MQGIIRKRNDGITLISLVITIIIMIILAAVAISIAMNGGLFDQATKGSEETRGAAAAEEVDVWKKEAIYARDFGGKVMTAEEKIAELLERGILTEEDRNKLINEKGEYNGDYVTIGTKEIDFNIGISLVGSDDSIPISTQEDLQKIANGNYEVLSDGNEYYMGAEESYILKNDITIEGYFEPIEYFDGVLDGDNFKIKNLEIDEWLSYDIHIYCGGDSWNNFCITFIVENYGTIANLNIENFNFDLDCSGAYDMLIGGICLYNEGTITNCSVDFDGELSTERSYSSYAIGGIAVQNEGTITNSYTSRIDKYYSNIS